MLRLARALRTETGAEGLSPAQSSALATLVREGPRTAGSLAQAEALNPTMVSRLVAHLAGRGLIERTTAADDRRCRLLRATPAGAELIDRLRAERARAVGARLDGLDAGQRRILAAALPALEALGRQGPTDAGGQR